MNSGRSKTDKLARQFCRIKLGALSGEGGKINTSRENLGSQSIEKEAFNNSYCDEDDCSGLKGVLAGGHRRLIKWKEKSRCGAEISCQDDDENDKKRTSSEV